MIVCVKRRYHIFRIDLDQCVQSLVNDFYNSIEPIELLNREPMNFMIQIPIGLLKT